MTDRVSGSASRNVCSREEEDSAHDSATACPARRPEEREVDWDRVPTMCDANAAEAARNATAGGMCGGKQAGVPMTSTGRASGETSTQVPAVQLGQQNEAQATTARLGYSGKNVSGSVEALTASAHIGLDNSDGSNGVNIGAVATAASAELTLKHSGWSATAGLSAGVGAEAHVGVRDDDKDGKPELCVRAAWDKFIGGFCIEAPVVIKM